MKIRVPVLALSLVAASAAAEIVTYPEYPAAIRRDWAYEVTVTQGSDTRSIPVYNHSVKSPLTGRTRGGDSYRRFCEFAFSGDPVRVDIRVCEDVQSYKVFPARLGLENSFSNGVISVWLDAPHSFGIELNDYVKTILSVIVDEPEDPADVPSPGDPNVLYIDGWMDPPGPDGVLVITNQCREVYIAPGAVLNSRLYVKRRGVHVHGRGMILDPFSDIFRYDQLNNTEFGVVKVANADVVVEDVKLVDARTFNYISSQSNTTFRNVKAFSAMMCSDGMTCSGRDFVMEGGWLYVGDNAFVVSGLKNEGRFRDVTIGTSCNAIFPQSSNTDVYMEDIDVFRCDEGLVSNIWNPESTNGVQRSQSFYFKNLSAVDSTLFSRFFLGANMGTLPKTFAFENLAIPNSTGVIDWHTIGNSGGQTIRVYDDKGLPWTTGNYELTITNLWVNGARSDGFAASEFSNTTGITVTVVNTAATPQVKVVPNKHVVNWTCPWKRYVGDSLQRDVRFATPEAGGHRLVEPNMWVNLVDDPQAALSVWQRSPSWTGKLDATRIEDGARIYRIRPRETQFGMYSEITDAFLRRGNGVYRLSFDARVVSGPDVPLEAVLLSDEDRLTQSFTLPNDGTWHSFNTLFTTDFDMSITELVGLVLRSKPGGVIVDFRNVSFMKVAATIDPSDFECSFEVSFPGYEGTSTLEDFPVLLRISPGRSGFHYDKGRVAEGGDLRFADSNGNILASEVKSWDENGESFVWVKVPYLDRNTVIRGFYGCENPPFVDAEGIWSNADSEHSADWVQATHDMVANDRFAKFTAPGVLGACRFDHEIEMAFPGVAAVGETLTDFPVLVRLSQAIPGFRYSDFHRPRGGDLRFFDSNGALLSHEIDTWNESGESLVWVKVPRLDASTVVTARYGCAGEPPGVAAEDVWSNGYVGVWHLGEGTLPMKESSRTTTDFTASGGSGIVFGASGAVGGSVDFGESGNSRMLLANDHAKLDGFTQCTIEAWTFLHSKWRNAPSGNKGLLGKRNGYFYKVSYYLYDTGAGTPFIMSTTGSDRFESPVSVSPSVDAWTHQAYTFSAGAVSGYRNGVLAGSGTVGTEQMYAGEAPLVLGSFDQNETRNYPGKVDELRISDVARSAGWMKATYETVMNANFATYAVRTCEYSQVFASESEGFDWTNRVVSVTGASAGETLTLSLSDGTSTSAAYTAVADVNGSATFDLPTVPGQNYTYAVKGAETVAAGSFLAGGWDSDGAWFLAAPDGQGGSTEVNSAWLRPPVRTNETAYVAGGTAALALADDAVAKGSNNLVRIDAQIVYPEFLEESIDVWSSARRYNTIAQMGPVTNTATGGPARWMAYVGGVWTELSGSIEPSIGKSYVVRFEGDFASGDPRVRFSVSADGGSTFETLVNEFTGSEWLVPADSTRHAMSEVATDGACEIGGIFGALANADVASAGGTGYASLDEALASGGDVTLLTNATWPTNAPVGTVVVNRGGYSLLLPSSGVAVDGNTVVVSAGLCAVAGKGSIRVTFADLAAVGINPAGRTPAQIAADLLEKGANGIPKWQSYVLGLGAAAQPYADIATGADPGTVEVSLGGVVVNESAGATVTYRVYEVEDLADFQYGGTESKAFAPTEKLLVPTSDSDSKFFRIKISIDLP